MQSTVDTNRAPLSTLALSELHAPLVLHANFNISSFEFDIRSYFKQFQLGLFDLPQLCERFQVDRRIISPFRSTVATTMDTCPVFADTTKIAPPGTVLLQKGSNNNVTSAFNFSSSHHHQLDAHVHPSSSPTTMQTVRFHSDEKSNANLISNSNSNTMTDASRPKQSNQTFSTNGHSSQVHIDKASSAGKPLNQRQSSFIDVSGDYQSVATDAAATAPTNRVLSIQSTVVHGYVGNRAAVFPLQLHGFEVDCINSCQLSNHTGYKNGFKGSKTTGDELKALMSGLRENGLNGLYYTELLSGYMSNVNFILEFISQLEQMKTENPRLYYVCDPVLGDNDRLYVPQEFVELYRRQIIVHAQLITPNQFEAELLSGIKIHSLASAHECCQWFHQLGIDSVVITSMTFDDDKDPSLCPLAHQLTPINIIASEKCRPRECISFHVLKQSLKSTVAGTGDLTTSLLLAFLKQCQWQLQPALERALSAIQATIKRTVTLDSNEMEIIASQSDLKQPKLTIKANRFHFN